MTVNSIVEIANRRAVVLNSWPTIRCGIIVINNKQAVVPSGITVIQQHLPYFIITREINASVQKFK